MLPSPGGSGWFDSGACISKPLFFWFSSRVISNGGNGFYDGCGEHWYFGGEIGGDGVTALLIANGKGDFRAFGTVIHANAHPSGTVALAIDVTGGDLHMHGGIINVNGTQSTATDVDVTAVRLGGNSLAHTPGTAYALKPKGAGSTTRLLDLQKFTTGTANPQLQAPFLWPAGINPPVLTVSKEGADIFVETDCGSDGNCNGGGSQAHMMVFNADECGAADPWLDSVTGRCRNR